MDLHGDLLEPPHSRWRDTWRPLLTQNWLYFVGVFLVLGSGLYLLSLAWAGLSGLSRHLVVLGSLTFGALAFAGLAALLRRAVDPEPARVFWLLAVAFLATGALAAGNLGGESMAFAGVCGALLVAGGFLLARGGERIARVSEVRLLAPLFAVGLALLWTTAIAQQEGAALVVLPYAGVLLLRAARRFTRLTGRWGVLLCFGPMVFTLLLQGGFSAWRLGEIGALASHGPFLAGAVSLLAMVALGRRGAAPGMNASLAFALALAVLGTLGSFAHPAARALGVALGAVACGAVAWRARSTALVGIAALAGAGVVPCAWLATSGSLDCPFVLWAALPYALVLLTADRFFGPTFAAGGRILRWGALLLTVAIAPAILMFSVEGAGLLSAGPLLAVALLGASERYRHKGLADFGMAFGLASLAIGAIHTPALPLLILATPLALAVVALGLERARLFPHVRATLFDAALVAIPGALVFWAQAAATLELAAHALALLNAVALAVLARATGHRAFAYLALGVGFVAVALGARAARELLGIPHQPLWLSLKALLGSALLFAISRRSQAAARPVGERLSLHGVPPSRWEGPLWSAPLRHASWALAALCAGLLVAFPHGVTAGVPVGLGLCVLLVHQGAVVRHPAFGYAFAAAFALAGVQLSPAMPDVTLAGLPIPGSRLLAGGAALLFAALVVGAGRLLPAGGTLRSTFFAPLANVLAILVVALVLVAARDTTVYLHAGALPGAYPLWAAGAALAAAAARVRPRERRLWITAALALCGVASMMPLAQALSGAVAIPVAIVLALAMVALAYSALSPVAPRLALEAADLAGVASMAAAGGALAVAILFPGHAYLCAIATLAALATQVRGLAPFPAIAAAVTATASVYLFGTELLAGPARWAVAVFPAVALWLALGFGLDALRRGFGDRRSFYGRVVDRVLPQLLLAALVAWALLALPFVTDWWVGLLAAVPALFALALVRRRDDHHRAFFAVALATTVFPLARLAGLHVGVGFGALAVPFALAAVRSGQRVWEGSALLSGLAAFSTLIGPISGDVPLALAGTAIAFAALAFRRDAPHWVLLAGAAAATALAALLPLGLPGAFPSAPHPLLPGLAVFLAVTGAIFSSIGPARVRSSGLVYTALATVLVFTLIRPWPLGIPDTATAVVVSATLVFLAFGWLQMAIARRSEPLAYVGWAALAGVYAVLRIELAFGGAAVEGFVVLAIGFLLLGLRLFWMRRAESLLARTASPISLLLPVAAVALSLRGGGLAHGLLAATGLFYAAVGYERGWRPLYMVASLLGNAEVVRYCLESHVTEVQWYALPAGATLIACTFFYGDALGRRGRNLLRTIGTLVIYVASIHPVLFLDRIRDVLVLAGVSLLGIFGGLLLRIRSYLYLGAAFLVLDVLVNLFRLGVADRVIGMVFLFVTGLCVLAVAVTFNLRKEAIRAWMGRVRARLAQFD
jgi:hypothetical protein